jgi:transcriptional antiterminator RfaH
MNSNGCAKKLWYAVQSKARQEQRAELNLQHQGFECYSPKYIRQQIKGGKKRVSEEYLFPGYLFVNLSREESWVPLRHTRGVTRIVSFGDKPLVVDGEVIVQLKTRSDAQVADSEIAVGERVLISDGPLAGLEAIFMSMDGEERVVLLMSLLHRQQQIVVPRSNISKG